MLVFRNLGEEVTGFNPKLPEKRKKEIQTGLLAVMDNLFPFLQTVLTNHFQAYRASGFKDASSRLRVASALSTLVAFMEFLPNK